MDVYWVRDSGLFTWPSTTTSEQMSPLTPPQLLERTGSCLFIVINWIVFIGSSVIMDNMTLPRWITRSGFPFIGGAIGAQNVCMGKYIAYATTDAIKVGQLTVRADVLTAVVLLCISSMVVHIVWLNRGSGKT